MLTRLQIQDNIDALEQQGASHDEIQEWLDSLPKQSSQAPTEAPKKEGIFKKIGKAVISSELKFGKSIADAMPSFVPGSAAWTNKQNEQIMANQNAMMDNLLARRKKIKAEAGDTSRLDAAIHDLQEQMSKPAIDINETNASVNKTAKQVFGEGLGVAADILSAGSYGKAAQGAQSGKLLIAGKASGKVATVLGKAGIGSTVAPAAGALPSIIGGGTKAQAALKGAWQGAKQGLVSGSVWGTAQGATRAMQDNKSNVDIASDAITGGVVGGVADLGREISQTDGYPSMLTQLIAEEHIADRFDFIVIDSPNQISPIMENAIFPADAFIVPFESTKAVKSYASIYKLLVKLRPSADFRMLHVLSNLSRLRGLRNRVLTLLANDHIEPARSEVRSCGWLAQVDENGGSIFHYRPLSKGAQDMAALVEEVRDLFSNGPQAHMEIASQDAITAQAA